MLDNKLEKGNIKGTKKFDEYTPFDEIDFSRNDGESLSDYLVPYTVDGGGDIDHDLFEAMLVETSGTTTSALFAQDSGAKSNDSIQNAEQIEGILEIFADGTGCVHLKEAVRGYMNIATPAKAIKFFDLRNGDRVFGVAVPQYKTKNLTLIMANKVNGVIISPSRKRQAFDKLTPIFPNERLSLDDRSRTDATMRLIDLLTPLAMGQRALIIAPPRSNRVANVKKMIMAIKENHPTTKVVALVVDQRPEDVTDISRNLDAEVYNCTFSITADQKVNMANLALNRCKRLVESGYNTIFVVDNLSSLARSYNFITPHSGRALSGWFDPVVFSKLKEFFATATKLEHSNSITMLATVADTGDMIDDCIIRELGSVANVELYLNEPNFADANACDIDFTKSYSSRMELFVPSSQIALADAIKVHLSKDSSYLQKVIDEMVKIQSNYEFMKTFRV